MRRLLIVSAVAALMAAMMVVGAPAMANDLFDHDNDHLDHFGGFNSLGLLDDDLFENDRDRCDDGHLGLFDDGLDRCDDGRLGHLGLFDDGLDHFDDEEEELSTIDVGDWECLVEDEDDVKFCVNEETGEKTSIV